METKVHTVFFQNLKSRGVRDTRASTTGANVHRDQAGRGLSSLNLPPRQSEPALGLDMGNLAYLDVQGSEGNLEDNTVASLGPRKQQGRGGSDRTRIYSNSCSLPGQIYGLKGVGTRPTTVLHSRTNVPFLYTNNAI
ncbi:hypothetical protein ElyMa_000319000 [Elysia marginata]|uniref:Uncharacterized protein n=1 Tax=Elysia marginata TaxID=1093978 RepID=A0AAV4F9U0_9GAST|nr:hypothetical protein ElyMa_000319000 [Elysia marginata]